MGAKRYNYPYYFVHSKAELQYAMRLMDMGMNYSETSRLTGISRSQLRRVRLGQSRRALGLYKKDEVADNTSHT